ncbi:armadillo repeat-containing protein 12-like isoform X3 [Hemicordylus capensis]|uniref:armadillo repeat-containing protein 12-like isoform X3 n=1 Tax=Hemicordylus capensis TaxID=884348 RepID=UPI0023026040|nr:armadillo repeat-containing protein 12-like isoform X3 [Hemicordylus capensis]
MKYSDLFTRQNVVLVVTGAGAVFLLAKAILAMFRSPPYRPESSNITRLSVEYRPSLTARANIPGELRRLLQSLSPHLDDVTKRTTLHTITQCILLKESEANACSYEDLKLVSTFLDDGDKAIKTEALNALKAFTNIWRFKIKIQVQLLRLLSTLAQKEDLLYDIMNCRTRPEFLSLFQPSLPGNLLFEMLFFVERLSEGRLTPQYQSMHRQYSDQSLHEVIFGENSRLSDRLLSLIIHPEEEVQIQACKVILSLRLNKEESKVVSGLPVGANVKVQPQEPTRSSQLTNSTLSNHRFRTSTLSSGAISSNQSHHRSCPQDENGRSFYTLQGIDETGYSFYPLQASAHRSFHPIETSSIQSFPVDECGRVIDDPMDSFHPINASYSDDSDDGTDL